MIVCDGSDNEDLEVKQEPMDSDKVKSEESPPGLKSEDLHSICQDVVADAQLQRVTGSGKLYMVEWGTQWEQNRVMLNRALSHQAWQHKLVKHKVNPKS